MHRQFNVQQFYVLPTQCIYVFCVDLRTNSNDATQAIIYLAAYVNVHPPTLPHELSAISDNQQHRSAPNAIQQLRVSKKSPHRMSHFSYGCELNDLSTCIYYENTKFLGTVSTNSQCTSLQSCYFFLYKDIVHHLAVLLLYPVPSHSAPPCSPVTLPCTKSQCTTFQSCYPILYQVTMHHLAVLLLYPVPSHNAPPCSPVTLSCTKSQCTTLQSCYSTLYAVTVHHPAVLLLYPVRSQSAPPCSPVALPCTKNTAAHKLKLAQCLLHLEQ